MIAGIQHEKLSVVSLCSLYNLRVFVTRKGERKKTNILVHKEICIEKLQNQQVSEGQMTPQGDSPMESIDLWRVILRQAQDRLHKSQIELLKPTKKIS